MKHNILVKLAVLIFLIAAFIIPNECKLLPGAVSEASAATADTISSKVTKYTLFIGEKREFEINGIDEDTKVTYTSAKKSIASVGKTTGVITAKAAGSVYITARVTKEDGTIKKVKCKIVVKSSKVNKLSSESALRKALTSGKGGRYQLTANIKGIKSGITIKSGTYILDLNGFQIEGASTTTSIILVNGGKLTLFGSGDGGYITNTQSQDAIGCSAGKLIINGGNFVGADYASYIEGGTVTINGGDFEGITETIRIRGGNVTINDGFFFSKGDDTKYGIGIQYSCREGNTSILTINGGEIAAPAFGISVGSRDTDKLIINGGDIYGLASGISASGGDIVINGGAFESDADGAWLSTFINGCKVEINGGTFTGKNAAISLQNDVDLKVVSGVFGGEVTDMLVYDTYTGTNEYNTSLFNKVQDNSAAAKGVTETEFSVVEISYTQGMEISDADSLYSLLMYASDKLLPEISFVTNEHLANVYDIYSYRWLDGRTRNIEAYIDSVEGQYTFKIKYDYTIDHEVKMLLAGNVTQSKSSNDAVKYVNQINTILDSVTTAKMTDKQKAIAVHDYMVKTYSYDKSLAKDSFSFYGPLNTNKAVCQGYATLFDMFMTALGIESECLPGMATSGPGKSDYEFHMWNRTLIDGQWLYTDVTFDDGLGSSTFLLLEEDTFYKKGYHY